VVTGVQTCTLPILRALRHMIEARTTAKGEPEIAEAAIKTLACLKKYTPILFDDYTVSRKGFVHVTSTPYRKV
jgi:thymidylate synthase ThyX